MEAAEANSILLAWVRQRGDEWPVESVRDRALRATLARSTRTVAAANTLLEGSYGPQALALSRTLFEDMIVAHWMTYCRSQAWVERRLRNQHDYSRLIWHEVMRKHQGPDCDGLDPKERRRIGRRRPRLEALFGKGAEKSWWACDIELVKNRRPGQKPYKVRKTRSLSDLIDELETHPDLENRWGQSVDAEGEGSGQSMIRWAYDVPQRLNNQMMIHHTAHALASVTGEESGEVAFIDEADENWLSQAGAFIYWTYMQLTMLMVDHGAPQLADDMQRNCKRPFLLAFHELSDEQLHWAKKNRNKGCPCGSGWKSKFCHGQ